MRNYKYTVHFKNGIQTEVNTTSYDNAAILGTAWAIKGGLSCEIEKITDEKDNAVIAIAVMVNYSHCSIPKETV